MADPPKEPFWKSLPGVLTAATGFVVALTGLVAGLNQLGLLKREQPAPPTVVTVTAPADNTAQDSAKGAMPEATPTVKASPAPLATTPRPTAPSTATPAPAPAPSALAPSDTPAGAPTTLPQGTQLDLASPARVCAPRNGQQRFTARLAAPVKVGGATVLPAGASAVLRLSRAGSGTAARLDSLVTKGKSLAVPAADVRIRSGQGAGACLKPNARLIATLGAAVSPPGR